MAWFKRNTETAAAEPTQNEGLVRALKNAQTALGAAEKVVAREPKHRHSSSSTAQSAAHAGVDVLRDEAHAALAKRAYPKRGKRRWFNVFGKKADQIAYDKTAEVRSTIDAVAQAGHHGVRGAFGWHGPVAQHNFAHHGEAALGDPKPRAKKKTPQLGEAGYDQTMHRVRHSGHGLRVRLPWTKQPAGAEPVYPGYTAQPNTEAVPASRALDVRRPSSR